MKLKQLTILFIFMLLLTACSTSIEPEKHAGEIYRVALDSMMKLDEALNSEMKYIAIDMSNFDEVDKDAKEEIINYINRTYKVEVMDATLEQLKERGLFNPDNMSLDGVLLRIAKIDFNLRETVFEGSKYKSGLGAVGVKGVVHYKNEKWKIKESKTTWVS